MDEAATPELFTEREKEILSLVLGALGRASELADVAREIRELRELTQEKLSRLDHIEAALEQFATTEQIELRVEGVEKREGRRRARTLTAVLVFIVVLAVALSTTARLSAVSACHRSNGTRAAFTQLLDRGERLSTSSPGLSADQRRTAVKFYEDSKRDVAPSTCSFWP